MIYFPTFSEQTFNAALTATSSLLLNSLFQRKMNTNYYLTFLDLPDRFGESYFNEELIWNEVNPQTKLLEEGKNNYYSLAPRRIVTDSKMQMIISIEETFSKTCILTINIGSCYDSCKTCSKWVDQSTSETHNCNECASNYFFFSGSSNCYTKEEGDSHDNWYSIILYKYLIYVIQVVKHAQVLVLKTV